MKNYFVPNPFILTTILSLLLTANIFSININSVSLTNFMSNEPPQIVWKHSNIIEMKAGTEQTLDFSCNDPEFHRMNAFIKQNHVSSTGHAKLTLKASLNKISIQLPSSASKNKVYVIDLEIKDEGNPPMSTIQTFSIKVI